MTAPEQAASDAELLMVHLFGPLGMRVVTELPATLETPHSLPIIQVSEVPGGGNLDNAALDTCVIEYEAYAVGRPSAKAIAEACRQLLIGAAGFAVPDPPMWLVRVVDTRKPTVLFYDEASDIRRYGGQARLYLRYRAP